MCATCNDIAVLGRLCPRKRTPCALRRPKAFCLATPMKWGPLAETVCVMDGEVV